MRVAIASRIFEPEPSAASFRLSALADALTAAEHETTVLTVTPPPALRGSERGGAADVRRSYRVQRAPVLRDSSGYVRGYLPYLSFDVPLFFRIVFGPKRDLLVVEPPPTTGFFVRIAAALRRTPYAYYAADIWSDAAAQTGAPAWMVRIVRSLERFALRGARTVLSVSDGVTERLRTFGVSDTVTTIGNGVDAARFLGALAETEPSDADAAAAKRRRGEFVYAGTASEWHGADVFVDALPRVLREVPHARVRFIGGGSERDALARRAEQLGVADAVSFEPVMSAEAIAPLLRHCEAAIASVRPGAGYDFAFPTKLYSAAVCGAPLIYSGPGPAAAFVRTVVDGAPLGHAVPPEVTAVADAMIACSRAADEDASAAYERRRVVSDWAEAHVGLDAVAVRAVAALGNRAKRTGRP